MVMLFVLALVVEYLVLPQLAGARKNLHLLARVNVVLLVLGLLLQAGSQLAYACLTRAEGNDTELKANAIRNALRRRSITGNPPTVIAALLERRTE